MLRDMLEAAGEEEAEEEEEAVEECSSWCHIWESTCMVCGMVENTPGHEEECSVREFNLCHKRMESHVAVFSF